MFRMQNSRSNEFCIIVEGYYESAEEAKHALVDPFVEEYVEENGKFRIHNYDEISVASGVSLGDLSLEMIDDGVFEISTKDSPQMLTRRRAEQIAESLRRQAMFDEVDIEPLEQE